jgi:cytochrome c biogenesis protein CcdA
LRSFTSRAAHRHNGPVLRLISIAISIGLADSLNPSTIVPALYLASGERPREAVTKFTAGVFLVYFLGGVLFAVGPGQLVLALVPQPGRQARNVLEMLAGLAMLAAAAMLWRHRRRLTSHELPRPRRSGRSSALLGAGITALELPTAFPYFFAIAAFVGSGFGLESQMLLLVLFNLCFVLPLVAIVLTLLVLGERAEARLARAREVLQTHWPVALAIIAGLAGVFVVLLGASGLGGELHGRIGRILRHVHHLLPH